jgi:hypothetical protein
MHIKRIHKTHVLSWRLILGTTVLAVLMVPLLSIISPTGSAVVMAQAGVGGGAQGGGSMGGGNGIEKGGAGDGKAGPTDAEETALREQTLCDPKDDDGCCPEGQCIIDKYINPAITVASAMVGIFVVISIIIAGITYSTSADNSQKVSEAKQRIVTAVFVLVGYVMLYAFLNWIIPGGLR